MKDFGNILRLTVSDVIGTPFLSSGASARQSSGLRCTSHQQLWSVQEQTGSYRIQYGVPLNDCQSFFSALEDKLINIQDG
jgi:hypothetical protein